MLIFKNYIQRYVFWLSPQGLQLWNSAIYHISSFDIVWHLLASKLKSKISNIEEVKQNQIQRTNKKLPQHDVMKLYQAQALDYN